MCLLQLGDTVLHKACYHGQTTAIAVILASKISVDIENFVS